MKIKSQNRKDQNNPISSDSAYDSVSYNPVKTWMLESEAEAEEPSNHKTHNQVLKMVYHSVSGCSDNLVLSEFLLSQHHQCAYCLEMNVIVSETLRTCTVESLCSHLLNNHHYEVASWQSPNRAYMH